MENFGAFLTAFADLAKMLLPVVYWGALLCGVIFAGLAMLKIVHMGKDMGGQAPTWTGVGGNLLVTLIGTSLAAWADHFGSEYGAIGEGITTQMAYMRDNTASSLQPMWSAIYAWMFLLGVIAIWRAALLFNRAAQGQQRDGDSWWAGFWHIVGGAILLNIATH